MKKQKNIKFKLNINHHCNFLIFNYLSYKYISIVRKLIHMSQDFLKNFVNQFVQNDELFKKFAGFKNKLLELKKKNLDDLNDVKKLVLQFTL